VALVKSSESDAGTLPYSAAVPVDSSSKQKVMELLQEGTSVFSSSPQTASAVEELLGMSQPGQLAGASMLMGQGTWEVFYAPHIANLAKTFGAGATFVPIRYALSGSSLVSNVQYKHPLLGTGWLSAAGLIGEKNDDTLQLTFEKFWIDVGTEEPRSEREIEAADSFGAGANLDRLIGTIGRAAFFPQFAVFPVLYVDSDIAVFKFPALDSNIAIARVPLQEL
jgi:hypothetical protein